MNAFSTARYTETHGSKPSSTKEKLFPFTIFCDEQGAGRQQSEDVQESEGKVLRLYAFTKSERDEWVRGIRKGVQVLQSNSETYQRRLREGDIVQDDIDITRERESVDMGAPEKPTAPDGEGGTDNLSRLRSFMSAQGTTSPPRRTKRASTFSTFLQTPGAIVGRFGDVARGSTDGFDMSQLSDRICVQYLRNMKTLGTERKGVEETLHPLLVQQTSKVLNLPELDFVNQRKVRQVESTYLAQYSLFKSGRKNVLETLRPLLQEFFEALESELDSARHGSGGSDLRKARLSIDVGEQDKLNGKVTVTVIKAINLRSVTNFNTQDPYVKLQLSGSRKSVSTNYCKGGGNNPHWTKKQNNKFVFPVTTSAPSLHVEVWHSSMVKDTFIGDNDISLKTFIENPGITERAWVALKATDGEGSGRLWLTIKYESNDVNDIDSPLDMAITRSSGNRRDRNNYAFGNLFVNLPQVNVNEHVWGEYVVCQISLEDTSAVSARFLTSKDMSEDGKITFSGWYPPGYQPEEAVPEEDAHQSPSGVLSMAVNNPHDIVLIEVYQYTLDGKQAMIGSAKISLMEILEVEACESFSAESQRRNRTMPECFLHLLSPNQANLNVGTISVGVLFVQDIWSIFSPTVVVPQTKPFSLGVFRENVARANRILDKGERLFDLYKEFMSWKDPSFTGMCTCVYITLCVFWFDYFLIIFPGAMGITLLHEYHFRLEGNFASLWHKDEMAHKVRLHVAVVKGSGMTPMNMSYLRPDDKSSDPYAIVSLGSAFAEEGLETRLIGRTNTEYLTLNPKWGRNQTSAGKSRLHIPGAGSTIENWGGHQTAFSTTMSLGDALTEQDIIIEVYDENPVSIGKHTYHDFMGEVKVPLQDLVSEKYELYGEQPVLEKWFDLSPLHSSTKTWSRHLRKEMKTRGTIGKIFVKLQLILPQEGDTAANARDERNKNGSVGNKQSSGSISGAKESQSQNQEQSDMAQYNLIGQYRKLRDAAFSIQNRIGSTSDLVERLKNLLIWAHPNKTQVVLYGCAFAFCVCMIIPSWFLMLSWGLTLVTEKFRKEGSMVKRMWHMLSTIPTDAELHSFYKNGTTPGQSGRQERKYGEEGKMAMFAKREGFLKTPGRSTFGRSISKINLRYFVLREDTGSLQWWLTKHQAHNGVPPRGELFLPANAIVAPVINDKGRQFDIEVRGYNSNIGLMPMILIARNQADQSGWLDALNAVINESRIRTNWRKRRSSGKKARD
jgi:hypothetical protein